jgi:hypothetical protein
MSNVGSIDVNIRADISNLQRGLNNMRTQLTGATSEVSRQTNSMASSFSSMATKLLGVTAAIAGLGKGFGDVIESYNKFESGNLGLKSILEAQGKDFGSAKGFIDNYISDGLVPLSDAVVAYKSLAARGYNDSQIKSTMTSLKDAAAFGRQAGLDIGSAVSGAAEGLKNENSMLVDNAGITKNVAKMWDDYAKSIGTTANKLTQQQKIQAEVSGIMTESKFQVGDASKYSATLGGQLATMGAQFEKLKTSIGAIFAPALSAVLPYITDAINGFSSLATSIASMSGGFITSFVTNLVSIKDNFIGLFSSASGDSLAAPLMGLVDTVNSLMTNVQGFLGDVWNIFKTGVLDYLASASFDTGLKAVDAVITNMITSVSGLFQGFNSLMEIIRNVYFEKADSISQAITTLLEGVTTLTTSIWEFQSAIATDAINMFNTVISESSDLIDGVFNTTIGLTTGLIEGLGSIFSTTGEGILKVYYDNIEPLKDLFFSVWNPISDLFLSLVNDVIDPVLMPAFKSLSDTINTYLPPIWTKVSDIFGKIISIVKAVWDTAFKPIINFISTTLLPVLKPIFEEFGLIVKDVFSSIMGLIDNVLGAFSGLLDFLLGTFTGDWTKAISGLGTIFDNVFKGLINMVRIPLNTIIRMMNKFFDNLSSIKIKVPKVDIPGIGAVGGGEIGFPKITLGEIPALASGGIASSPTLAMIGEGKYSEVVQPLGGPKYDALIEGVSNAVVSAMSMTSNSNNRTSKSGDIVISIDGSQLARIANPYFEAEQRRSGTKLILST